jgi:hypothetical protein
MIERESVTEFLVPAMTIASDGRCKAAIEETHFA